MTITTSGRHTDDTGATLDRAERRRAARRAAEPEASPPNMSIPDTAEYLGVNEATVRVMIADKRLRAYRLGDRVIRLRRSDIDAALKPSDVV